MTHPDLSQLLAHLAEHSHLISLTDANANMYGLGDVECEMHSEEDTERLLDQYVELGVLRKTDASDGEIFYWLKETVCYTVNTAAIRPKDAAT